MLILIGGPDRVGKSTLATRLSELSGIPVNHHSAPDPKDQSIFSVYKREAFDGGDQIWDRSYLCAYILERHRKGTHDHIVDIVDLELILSEQHSVVHVGLSRPWHWSASHHIAELKEQFPEAQPWFLRDMLMARQTEHHFYTDEMVNFYQYMTMFPSFMVDPSWGASDVWANIQSIASSP
jgi:hypothetical protein